jgi:uncharacterized phiE125 gp8 family phage protein
VVEPITLAEAKAHCRIDTSTDDTYVGTLISAAREWVEDYLDRSLVTQQLTMRMDKFPTEIELPRPPMATAGTATTVVVTYVSGDNGSTATLAASAYRVDREATPGVIRNLYGQSWPSHLSDQNSVTVTWWAGYGSVGTSVPTRVRHAMLMLLATWYERRLSADNAGNNEVPFGVRSLLDSVSWGNYR